MENFASDQTKSGSPPNIPLNEESQQQQETERKFGIETDQSPSNHISVEKQTQTTTTSTTMDTNAAQPLAFGPFNPLNPLNLPQDLISSHQTDESGLTLANPPLIQGANAMNLLPTPNLLPYVPYNTEMGAANAFAFVPDISGTSTTTTPNVSNQQEEEKPKEKTSPKSSPAAKKKKSPASSKGESFNI